MNEVNQNPEYFMKKVWGKNKPDPSKFLAQIEAEVKKEPSNPSAHCS
jgi:hypothetical protein